MTTRVPGWRRREGNAMLAWPHETRSMLYICISFCIICLPRSQSNHITKEKKKSCNESLPKRSTLECGFPIVLVNISATHDIAMQTKNF